MMQTDGESYWVTVPVRGAGCILIVVIAHELRGRYCPREGCGLHQERINTVQQILTVTVPVRGAGCITNKPHTSTMVPRVTVPVRGAGCICHGSAVWYVSSVLLSP